LKTDAVMPPTMLSVFAQNVVPLTIICAPAGFGKTEALSCIYSHGQAGPRLMAWFDCERRAPQELDTALQRGTGDLGALFVDGADRLPLRTIATLVNWVFTSGAKLFLTARKLGDFRLARHIAAGQAQILPPELLLWRRGQLAAVNAARLSSGQVAQIERLTEGWASPSILLASHFAHGGRSDTQGVYLRDSHVAGFIADEVLADLSRASRACLVALSLAEEFDGDLIDCLWTDGDLTVEALRDKLGPLMVPAGRPGDWRFNRLLRLNLQLEFARLGRTARNAVRAIVTNWAASRGDVVAAGTIAIQEGGNSQFLKLVTDAGGLTLWLTRGYDHVRQLVKIADDADIEGDPRFQLLRCAALLKEGRVAEADGLYEKALSCLPNTPEARRDAAFLQVTLLVYGCRDPTPEDAPAFHLLETFALDEGWNTALPTIRAIHHSQHADFDAALGAIFEAESQATSGVDYNLMFLDMHRAEILLAQGNLTAARKALLRARSRWRRDYPQDRGAETVLSAFFAQLEFEGGNSRNASMHLRKSASRVAQSEAWLDVYVASLEPMFRLAAERHGVPAAVIAIERLRAQLSEQGLDRIAQILGGLRIALEGEEWLRSGDGFAPASLLSTKINSAPNQHASWQEREFAALAGAFLDLASGEAQRALKRLTRLIDYARQKNLLRTLLRALLLRSAVFDRLGKDSMASVDFKEALCIGEATGLRRAFAEFGGRHTVNQLTKSQANNFAEGLAGLAKTAAPLAERPLTQRETQILQALRSGRSDKAIGRDLGITEHGVRFHLKNLYAKLGVHDRASAVEKSDLPA
jgi:LuxR family transcriptional regulator, maltose regulon positive regulatory protein